MRNTRGDHQVEFDDGVLQFVPSSWVYVLSKVAAPSSNARRQRAQQQQEHQRNLWQQQQQQQRDGAEVGSSDVESSSADEAFWSLASEDEDSNDDRRTAHHNTNTDANRTKRPHHRQHRRQPSTYTKPEPVVNVVLVEGVPILEEEGTMNRVPLHRRLPDDYPYVLERIGETTEPPL